MAENRKRDPLPWGDVGSVHERDAYGLLVLPPPDVDELRQYLLNAGKGELLDGLVNRLTFDANRTSEARSMIQKLEQDFVGHKIARYVEYEQSKGTLAPEEQLSKLELDEARASQSDKGPGPARIPVHPNVDEMCINIHLLISYAVLTTQQPNKKRLDKAREHARKAYTRAVATSREALIARCQFYMGLVLFCQKSFPQAMKCFEQATEAETYFAEGDCAQEWVEECGKLLETRSEA
ncbi:hypothetical protein AAFC00_006901 [Neodothiora populina]|uniref:Uncharacterized protein n=1 Tax=Neodothiora populina TaxID=2781224 RepID=A0ABR3PBP0_9PEZI